jgi:ABC-type Fe3+/spermidine/putrescine transport system ATPase subunit
LEPQLILLDEPLSNLDAKLREEMRVELRKLIKRIGISALYVTHDQEEAFTISDSVIVMNRGKIVQYASPKDIYNRPATEFVASFVGHSVLVDGKLLQVGPKDCVVVIPEFNGAALACAHSEQLSAGAACKLVIRTSEIRLSGERLDHEDNVIPGTMLSREDRGGFTDHRILVGTREIVVTSHRHCPLIDIDAAGGTVFLHIDRASISLIPDVGRVHEVAPPEELRAAGETRHG